MASYKLIGQRNLRKYTEAKTSPTYAAAIEAQTIVDSLCGIPWKKVAARDATMTYHTEDTVAEIGGQKINGLEMNVRIRDQFDAALFCAGHVGGQHRAYANSSVYHYVLPDGTLPKLTKFTANVTSDPYNSAGARIAILTNATGEIPTNCNTCRTGDAHADGVAPRTVAENGNWFPTMTDCVFSADPGEGETALPTGGLQLQKHLFVFVLMESYSTVRGNWLEGCSFIRNLVSIETDADITGWIDGTTIDLSVGELEHECVVCRDGVVPANDQESSGIRSVQLALDGSKLVKKTADIPAIEGGLYKLVSEHLTKLKGISDGEITCLSPFQVEDRAATSTFRKYIAVGGTFLGGTFAEIDGLYLFDLSSNAVIEGVSLGNDNVPPWLKTFAHDHGGFAHVTTIPRVSNSSYCGFSCIGCDGAAIAISGSDAGLAPAFSIWLTDGSDSSSFAASSLSGNQSPTVMFIQDATQGQITASAKMINADRFVHQALVGGGSTYDRSAALVGFQDGNDLILAFPFWRYRYVSTGGITTIASDTSVINPGITGRVTGVFSGETFNGGANQSTRSNIYVTGELMVNGQATNVAFVTVDNIVMTTNTYGSINLVSVSIPSFASALTPDAVDGFGIRPNFSRDTSYAEFIVGYEQAVVFGSFNSLGGVAHHNAVLLDPRTGEMTSSDADAPLDLAFLSDGNVFAKREGQEARQVEYYEVNNATATGDQSAIGLRNVSYAFARGEGNHIPASVAGPTRIGASHNIRQTTVTVQTLSGDVLVPRTVPVWRLTSSVMLLPFALQQTFVARQIHLEWPEINATAGAQFNVWIRAGLYTDLEAVTNIRLFNASESNVDGWLLIGTIDACSENRTATFELGTIEDFGCTLLLTAYVRPDTSPSETIYPVGAATDLNVDPIHGSCTSLDSGWRPDITLLG